MVDNIWVLHVDDESDFAELTRELLQREDERIHTVTETSASEGLDRLARDDFDCVVSDYDMPGQNGIEFLETVREEYPDLPFILYTGKGSEEVASEAISKGVTDYLQKETGTSQYTVLFNRIENAVSQYYTQRKLDRQQAESAQLLEWLDHALTVTDTYVWEWDLKSDKIQRHPTTEPVFGIKSDAIGGVHEGWIKYIHPDDRSAVEETITEGIESGEGYQVTCRVETEDGSWRWVRDRAEVETENGELIQAVGSVTDVTNQMEREKELRRVKTEYETLLVTAQHAIFLFDVERADQDYEFRLRHLNPAHEAKSGLSSEDDRGKTPVELLGQEVGTEVAANYRRCVEAKEPISYEEELEMPAGDIYWQTNLAPVIEDGEVTQIVGVAQDTSEREQFQTFIERSTDIVTVLDANGIYQYQSPSSERITGYEPEELLGENAFEYIHSDDRQRVMEKFSEAVENPALNPKAEYRFQHKDGSWLWLESRGNFQLDNPVIEGFVVNTRNVTERKEREEALERQNERLEEFAGVVSHDLRNPLRVVEGQLELAREECDSEYLDTAVGNIERSFDLIDDMLTLAQQGQRVSDMEAVDMASVVETCWENVATATATVVADIDATIQADSGRLRQLLENLMRNAVEHSTEDVTVRVGSLPDGFYVADSGPGIPEADRETVFEPGYSESQEGTGFGLAIVRRIAHAHDWEWQVTEGADGGARFEFTNVATPAE